MKDVYDVLKINLRSIPTNTSFDGKMSKDERFCDGLMKNHIVSRDAVSGSLIFLDEGSSSIIE